MVTVVMMKCRPSLKGYSPVIFKLALAFLFVPMFKKTPQVYSGLARRRVKEQHPEKVRV